MNEMQRYRPAVSFFNYFVLSYTPKIKQVHDPHEALVTRSGAQDPKFGTPALVRGRMVCVCVCVRN